MRGCRPSHHDRTVGQPSIGSSTHSPAQRPLHGRLWQDGAPPPRDCRRAHTGHRATPFKHALRAPTTLVHGDRNRDAKPPAAPTRRRHRRRRRGRGARGEVRRGQRASAPVASELPECARRPAGEHGENRYGSPAATAARQRRLTLIAAAPPQRDAGPAAQATPSHSSACTSRRSHRGTGRCAQGTSSTQLSGSHRDQVPRDASSSPTRGRSSPSVTAPSPNQREASVRTTSRAERSHSTRDNGRIAAAAPEMARPPCVRRHAPERAAALMVGRDGA